MIQIRIVEKFERYVNLIVRIGAVLILLVVGYYQYIDSYQFPKWKVFLSGMVMGAPLSVALFVCTTSWGRRFKITTVFGILLSAGVRSLLLVPPPVCYFVFLVELLAIWSLFSGGGKK